MHDKTVMVLSGGLDSTTLLYDLVQKGDEVFPISFDYGQKHSRELLMAKKTCKSLNLDLKVIDVSSMKDLLKSALTSDIEVPYGHYEEESMKQTVVPNRNMIFISMAAAYALSIDANRIALGVHAGDHAIYPDCRSEFILLAERTINEGNWTEHLGIYTPYINMSKTEIVKRGLELNVNFSLTQTCYEGKEKACGKCGSCQERLESFKLNNTQDTLEYENHR